MLKSKWSKIHLPVSLALAVLLSACGQGQPILQASPTPAAGTSLTNPNNWLGGGTNTPNTNPSPTASPTNGTGSSLPPIAEYFSVQGGGTYTSAPFNTDSILKVTITAGAPTNIQNTGFTANYSCLQFNVKVGSQSQQVKVSYGNPSAGPCQGVASSQTLNFNTQVTAGQKNLTVTISQPIYDNCRLYYPYGWGVYYAGCPMSSVYQTHAVSGLLQIHTNMTQ